MQTISIVYHLYVYANDFKIVSSQKTLGKNASSCLKREIINKKTFLHFHLIMLLYGKAICKKCNNPQSNLLLCCQLQINKLENITILNIKENNTFIWFTYFRYIFQYLQIDIVYDIDFFSHG